MNTGDRIQRCRKERGWTQKQLADRSGVPQAAISKIERGTVKPLFETVVRIAGAFGLGLDELAGNAAPRTRKKGEMDPALMAILQTHPSLAGALKNPEIIKLITALSPEFPRSPRHKNQDALALLRVTAKMLEEG